MNRLFLSVVVSIFFINSISLADMAVNEPANPYIPPGNILKKQDVQPVQDLGVIKVNFRRSNLKRSIALAQIERDAPDVKDSVDLNTGNSKYAGFLSAVSPDYGYRVNRNFLSLARVPISRRKRSIMFVFLMNDPNRRPTDAPSAKNERTRMHVLWPGTKRMRMEQQMIRNEYPVDVSVANYEDGYAPGEWNVVLPNKKPREIAVSALWSF